jgi:hypothetical protein
MEDDTVAAGRKLEDTQQENYTLFADRGKAIRSLNFSVLCINLPIIVMLYIAGSCLNWKVAIPYTVDHRYSYYADIPLPSWYPLLLLAFSAGSYLFTLQSINKQSKPIVALSTEGIIVDTTATHLPLIFWNEIKEVKSYTFIYRYVGIVPNDSKALFRRLGFRNTWLMQMNASCVWFYRAFGITFSEINIPQVYLPISADELTSKIRGFHDRFGFLLEPPDLTDEAVWPPRPQPHG